MKTLTALTVLVLLALGADRAAEYVAERYAADHAREMLGLTGAVEVEVGGFPFLTQLATGQFDAVRVRAGQVLLGRVTASRLTVTAHEVAADYDHPTATRAERVRLGVLVPYEQIDHVAPEGVRVGPAGPRSLRVRAPLAVPGREVTARSRIRVEGGTVIVRAQRMWVNGTPIEDTGLDARVRGRLDFSVPLDALPRGVEVTGVTARAEGVVVHGEVRGLALARLGRVGG